MENIVKAHKKVLEHVLNLRKTDSSLFFVPRKINNQKRLENGYWFIGNDSYLMISFWQGMDWKEKIHNIGFVVLPDGKSYIELSAQDSNLKAKFLDKIAATIPGTKKEKNKNKWFKHFNDKDYIKHLDNFIKKIKPKIDILIQTEKPNGISLLNETIFHKYFAKLTAVKSKQDTFGSINKLSKICWNTENWKFPSGSKGKSVSIDSYEADTGYGHEEWLFDKLRIIDGYHYAFLQPLNIKSNIHHSKKYNISLYTINNLQKKYYVGEIKNVECITKDESIYAFNLYNKNGWLKEMQKDLEKVGANYSEFNQTPPEIFFNIKFRFKDVYRPDDLLEISKKDTNITTNRYKLLPRKTEILIDIQHEEGGGNKKNTNKRRKVFNSDVEFDPYHDMMQNAIFEVLKASKYYKKVFIETGRVDLKAINHSGEWDYFELKTDNAKQSIRKALGQILEYAYFPEEEKAHKLIIVADEKPNMDVIKYLNHIRKKFKIPLTYRYFDIESNFLSEDY